jgi:hypothetical protein
VKTAAKGMGLSKRSALFKKESTHRKDRGALIFKKTLLNEADKSLQV